MRAAGIHQASFPSQAAGMVAHATRGYVTSTRSTCASHAHEHAKQALCAGWVDAAYLRRASSALALAAANDVPSVRQHLADASATAAATDGTWSHGRLPMQLVAVVAAARANGQLDDCRRAASDLSGGPADSAGLPDGGASHPQEAAALPLGVTSGARGSSRAARRWAIPGA